jgi:pimeloyl-ACP methyl ester carboxylesterase
VTQRRVVRAAFAMGTLYIALTAGATARAVVEPASNETQARTFSVGSMQLLPCTDSPAYCGELGRPLDPTGALPDRISIHFEYYRHRGPGKATGTLVATEGGPGFPATLSRDEYLSLFKPLMSDRDVVLMDNRGTGRSGAIDCHALQTAPQWTIDLIAACGVSLGSRAALYSTAYAADDLAAILQALQIAHIDLYGDSYGTYFEQVFAVRHPRLLRSIVLDGAYPLNGPDYAWYSSYAPAMRDKFDIACRRSAPCAQLPGSSIDHIRPLLEELRRHPFQAHAADVDGVDRQFTADAAKLSIVMFGSAPALTTVRELDAAARAFMEGDKFPMLRLMAETTSAVDSRDPSADPTQWSAGLAAAVTCQDPPQIFDMRLEPTLRVAARDRAIAERKLRFPDTYFPFSIDEYRGMPLDYSFLDQCVAWPVAPANHPAAQVVAVDAPYPDVPALIISGELDNMTTMIDGAAVAAAFKHGRQIKIANGFHVNALPHSRSECGAQLVRRFIEKLDAGDAQCAARVPPVRLVPKFVTRSAELAPVEGLSGNRADAQTLRQVQAAVMTVGDVLARLPTNSSGHGLGLRGGGFEIATNKAGVRVTLKEVRWTDDVAVSGNVDRSAGRNADVQATLTIIGPSAIPGQLRIQWTGNGTDPMAHIDGAIGAATVIARVPAP